MIRSIDIVEKYETSLQTRQGYCEIFLNPDSADFREISSKYLRFVADDNKKEIYVWDAEVALHSDVIRKIPVTLHSDGVFYGQVKREGSKYVLLREITPEDVKSAFLFQPQDASYWKDILGRDWTWTRQHGIDLDTELNNYRSILYIRPR
jgi:hypothetical protein